MHVQFNGGRGWNGEVVVGGLTGQDGVEVLPAELD